MRQFSFIVENIYLLQFLAIQLSQIAGIETLDTIAVSLHDIHFFFIIYLSPSVEIIKFRYWHQAFIFIT